MTLRIFFYTPSFLMMDNTNLMKLRLFRKSDFAEKHVHSMCQCVRLFDEQLLQKSEKILRL